MLLPGFLGHLEKIGYERRWVATILGIQLFAVAFEGIGIGMVLPVLEYINNDGDLEQLAAGSRLWRWMVDAAAAIGAPLNLATLLGAVFLAVVIRQIFLYARQVYIGVVQAELTRRVRDRGFRRYIRADLGYHDRVRAGDFVNELTTELERATGAMTSAVNFLGYVLLGLAYIAIVFSLSQPLTLMALGVLTLSALLLVRIMNRIRELGKRVTGANQEMSSFLVERLKSVRLVRLSGVEEAEEEALAGRTREQRDRTVDQRKLLALLSVLVEPIILAIAFVLLYLSVTTIGLGFETMVLFFFILIRLVPILKEAVMSRQSYLASLASVEAIDTRMRELDAARDPAGGNIPIERLDRGIDLRGVRFHYDASADELRPTAALDGVTLTIAARRMTALVGPSGSGKSTLVDLLPRLRDAQGGEILFDGVPQKELDIASLRRAISFAPQSPQMFNVTVADHIRYGWREASPEDIREAARLAQADAFIEALPDGYDTFLGEGGGRLSGGQRQRLDLARALVRRAPILILDEPTSNLDAESEALFRAALDRIRAETETTIVIIGHRLSTIMSADRIAVMVAGRVAASGTHAELMAANGWYADAVAHQDGRRLSVEALITQGA